MLAILPLAMALSWLGIVRATPTNITILDQSPMITYYPSRSGIDTQTWNVTYDGTSWSEFPPGSIANGTSMHKTYFIGATASFGFKGTAFYLLGSGQDYIVTANGDTVTNGGESGIMAMKSDMENKWWDVVVKVTGSGGVAIQSVIFTVGIGNDGASLSSQEIQTLTAQNQPNPDLSFFGTWNTGTVAGPFECGSLAVPQKLIARRIVLPAVSQETFMVLYGAVNTDHEAIEVTSSGPSPGWPGTKSFNGNSPWMSLDQVQWYGMADWGVVSVQNMQDGKYFDLSRIQLITASGGTPASVSKSNKLGIGAIVGIAIGAVAFLTLVGVALWLCYRKIERETKYHSANHPDTNIPYEIDPYTETTVAAPARGFGYFDSPEMAYAMASGVSSTTKSPHSRTSFGAMPIAHMPGLSPYSPHSQQMSEGSSDLPSSLPGASSASQTSLHRSSKSPRRVSQVDNQVRQETDAGRMVVPPSYDPTWAQDGPTAAEPMAPIVNGDGAASSQQGDRMKDQLRSGAAVQ